MPQSVRVPLSIDSLHSGATVLDENGRRGVVIATMPERGTVHVRFGQTKRVMRMEEIFLPK